MKSIGEYVLCKMNDDGYFNSTKPFETDTFPIIKKFEIIGTYPQGKETTYYIIHVTKPLLKEGVSSCGLYKIMESDLEMYGMDRKYMGETVIAVRVGAAGEPNKTRCRRCYTR